MTSSCRANGNEVSRVEAMAVVPSLIYAFRECVGECLAAGEEILVLIGPPSGWAVSSAPWPNEQLQRQSGSFSKVRVPLKRGSSATAAITVSYPAIGRFVSLHRRVAAPGDVGLGAAQEVSFELEAIWPTDDPAPSGMVVTSSSNRDAGDLLRGMGIEP